MTIKRSDAIFISSDISEQKTKRKYCPVCGLYNIRHQLHKRVYNEQELVYGQLPADHNKWLQCFHCGNLFLKDNVAQEGKLTTEIEIPKSNIGQSEEEHLEKPKHQRGFNERLFKPEDYTKDPEVKKALKRGAKLISYEER